MCDNDQTQSLLMTACKAGDIDCVKSLFKNNSISNYLFHNFSLLRSICIRGDNEMLKYILDRGLEIDDDLILSCFTSEAIMSYNEIAQTLFEHILDVNFSDEAGDSFLRRACKAGNVILATKLLKKGADRYRVSPVYGDSLRAATLQGHVEVVKLLLSWDSQGNRIPSESLKEALNLASKHDHVAIVRSIVEYGVDAEDLAYALRLSVLRNRVEVAAYLIINGADINATFDNGSSIITLACSFDYADMLQMLICRGADPNHVFASGSTLLLHVVQPKHRDQSDSVETLTLLLGRGADPNLAHATTGKTPLMAAVFESLVSYVKLLLEHGADVTQVNSEGKSVMDVLGQRRDNRYDEVIELCKEYIEINRPRVEPILK